MKCTSCKYYDGRNKECYCFTPPLKVRRKIKSCPFYERYNGEKIFMF
jgi:hypothetical protein